MTEKKFRKFVLVDPVVFERIKSKSIYGDHLSDLENRMIDVLRNSNLSQSDRLKNYRQMLYYHIRNNLPINDKSLLKKSTTQDTSSQTKKNRSASKSTTTNADQIMQDFSNQTAFEEIANAPKNNTTTQTDEDLSRFHIPLLEETIHEDEGSMPDISSLSLRRKRPEETELNVYQEQENFIREIRRQSMDPNVDINALKYKHLSNPDKDYIFVENPQTGEQFSIAKTPAVIRQQNKNRPTASSRLDSKNLSPRKLRSGLNLSVARNYKPYEQLSKKK